MANVLNRTTKEYRRSANTPDYSSADWIVNPDLSAVEGWPARYWEIVGDTVSLADPATRSAIDAALVEAARDSVVAQLDQQEDILRAFADLLVDELNLHAQRVNAVRDAVANAANLNDAKNAAAAVPDVPTRTLADLRAAIRGKLGS